MPKSPSEYGRYFHKRAARFNAFYRTETVARMLGRGALFDRLRQTVAIVAALGARRVLDVGCGSGVLFGPLADMGVHVVGVDPAPAMVALARAKAQEYPGLVSVEEQGWETIDEDDTFDVAAALGVFDYIEDPVPLLRLMGRAAPHCVASFPAPGLRLRLRVIRYGARGVGVHGYTRDSIASAAAQAGLAVEAVVPLDRAGYLVHFTRSRP